MDRNATLPRGERLYVFTTIRSDGGALFIAPFTDLADELSLSANAKSSRTR